jgi:aspartate beta-hydroxylase
MNTPLVPEHLKPRLLSARKLAQSAQVLQAEAAYAAILKEWPECVEACALLARFAMERGDPLRAANLLERARVVEPDEPQLAVNLGYAYAKSGRPVGARNLMDATVARFPDFYAAWMLLGQLAEGIGDRTTASKAYSQSIKLAQRKGMWLDEATTPPQHQTMVMNAVQQVRLWWREQFFASFQALREKYGNDELKRVDRALAGYLGEADATPADPRQRPKFLYFQDLPSTPYLDPYLQPWAQTLVDAFPDVRAEAAQLLDEQVPLPGFLTFKEGDKVEKYLTGTGPNPAWDAFFFYRRGRRYDDNHLRCPKTSALLESIDLCRIRDQTPEICFSVLTPGSHIMPHFGVTNTRVVMHMPLIVPGECALKIVDGEEHRWKEGELMMFDDTFQHEAWNKSDQTRVNLLMDCWNPHLTEVEKLALKELVETISDFEIDTKVN